MALSKQKIQELNDFQAELEAEYKSRLSKPEDLAEFEECKKSVTFDYSLFYEEGDFLGWCFEDEDDEIKAFKSVINAVEKIKHEYDAIPVKLKTFAFIRILDSVQKTVIDSEFPICNPLEGLDILFDASIRTVENVFIFALCNDEFINHVLLESCFAKLNYQELEYDEEVSV